MKPFPASSASGYWMMHILQVWQLQMLSHPPSSNVGARNSKMVKVFII